MPQPLVILELGSQALRSVAPTSAGMRRAWARFGERRGVVDQPASLIAATGD